MLWVYFFIFEKLVFISGVVGGEWWNMYYCGIIEVLYFAGSKNKK